MTERRSGRHTDDGRDIHRDIQTEKREIGKYIDIVPYIYIQKDKQTNEHRTTEGHRLRNKLTYRDTGRLTETNAANRESNKQTYREAYIQTYTAAGRQTNKQKKGKHGQTQTEGHTGNGARGKTERQTYTYSLDHTYIHTYIHTYGDIYTYIQPGTCRHADRHRHRQTNRQALNQLGIDTNIQTNTQTTEPADTHRYIQKRKQQTNIHIE